MATTTKPIDPCKPRDPLTANRLGGLRRFAMAITILNLFGHFYLGFEQSWAQPLVALASAYTMELLVEIVDARACRRPLRFLGGGIQNFIDFFCSPHISGLACAMLLYANNRLTVIAFAAAVAIGSKAILRAPVGKGYRHFMNPSNFGITMTLVLFPWVGIAPPYHFTENLRTFGSWFLPILICCTGTFLNTRFTKRLPLILAWVSSFILQGLLRHLIFGSSFQGALQPMTGVAFVLFTFYMITDPPTTPVRPWAQVLFGFSVAMGYGILVANHIVFGMFFALTTVCLVRGISLHVIARRAATSPVPLPQPAVKATVFVTDPATVSAAVNAGELSATIGGK